MDEAQCGATHLALFSKTNSPWLFSAYPYGENWSGVQPVCRFARTLENGAADHVFRDRVGGGLSFTLEKPSCASGNRDWLVADYGRSLRESLGSPGPRARS